MVNILGVSYRCPEELIIQQFVKSDPKYVFITGHGMCEVSKQLDGKTIINLGIILSGNMIG